MLFSCPLYEFFTFETRHPYLNVHEIHVLYIYNFPPPCVPTGRRTKENQYGFLLFVFRWVFLYSVHKFLNIKFTFGKVFFVRHVCTPTSLLYIGRFYIMFHSYTFLADARRTYVSAVEHYG